jgi:amino acid adenylation domain-containing protein
MADLLHQLLERAAEARPDGPAVVDGRRVLTYTELDERSSRLAHLLRDLGVRRGDRVGLYFEKSADAIVAVYAALKAGAAYVPLDAQAPETRLAYLARDCDIGCLLTTSRKARQWGRLLQSGAAIGTVVTLDAAEDGASTDVPPPARLVGLDAIESQPATRPEAAAEGRADDLAYLLYTSGSTGQPKGVMLSHRNGLAFVEWAVEEFEIVQEDRLSNHAPLHFDLSILDIFAASLAAATVVLVPRQAVVFPIELARFIDREQITVWYSVPSALSMLTARGNLARGALPGLRRVLFAGEVFPAKYLRRLMSLLPHVRFSNLFGPTETNVCTWYDVHPLPDDQDATVPIGKAITDVEVFAVTEDGVRARPGETGELYVRGPTVMQGYWGDPERTAESLVPHPLAPELRERVYRTGDLVQAGDDGNYRFLGRRDTQIKSRGYRIELGEIEAVLYGSPDVLECAVLAIPDDLVTNRLAAAVVTANGLGAAELAPLCRNRLPPYMVPELFDLRDRLPRTSTGKVDRTMLTSELADKLAKPRG